MQKMVAMGQKLGHSEPQRAKLAGENAQLQNTIARLERERNQARANVDELRIKLEGAEDSLNQTLTELEASKTEAKEAYQQGYNEGIAVATDSYKDQMPGIQDQVFAAGWTACLRKIGTAESSPLWTEIELPSIMAAQGDDDTVEVEDSLDAELNANVPEQQGADAAQSVEVTNPGQKEASGGPTDGSTAAEVVPDQVPPPSAQDPSLDQQV
jgi:dsDNA-specific endonuclease/ATPase MutS2